jgi:hypothetical protein
MSKKSKYCMLQVFAVLIKVGRASRIPRLGDARDDAITHGPPSLASSRPGSLPLNDLVFNVEIAW